MRRLIKWLGISCGIVALLFAILAVLAARGVIGPPAIPPEVVASSVQRDAALLERAWALPAAVTYGAEHHWQSNGSYCGPASLVNVYRSLGTAVEDEGDVLAGTGKCLPGSCFMGLSLDELAEVARANPEHQVTVLRNLSPDEFHEHLRRSNDPAVRYVVNFTRKGIFGQGGGHHSPIAGYLEDADLVLVLDVNAKYGPWLVERERLFGAMDTLDGEKKRGLLLIE